MTKPLSFPFGPPTQNFPRGSFSTRRNEGRTNTKALNNQNRKNP